MIVTAYKNRILRVITLVLLTAVLCVACGCEKLDANYGKKSEEKNTENVEDAPLVYPEIKSTDTTMPKYFDISLFDEENYSSVYLPLNFKYFIFCFVIYL